MGTFLGFATGTVWTWIDGDLLVPEAWSGPDQATLRPRLGAPADRQFAPKIALAWQLIQRVQIPSEAILCDDRSGRNQPFRRQMDEAHLLYLGDIPANTLVYRSRPLRHWCQHQWQVTTGVPALTVAQLGQQLSGPRYQVRPGERGTITNRFAMTRVWRL